MNTLLPTMPLSTTASALLNTAPDTPVADPALRDACRQFEGLLTSFMFKAMRETVPDGGLFPQSQGDKIFQEMLDQQYADQMSRTHPLGLAAAMYARMSQQAKPKAGIDNQR